MRLVLIKPKFLMKLLFLQICAAFSKVSNKSTTGIFVKKVNIPMPSPMVIKTCINMPKDLNAFMAILEANSKPTDIRAAKRKRGNKSTTISTKVNPQINPATIDPIGMVIIPHKKPKNISV